MPAYLRDRAMGGLQVVTLLEIKPSDEASLLLEHLVLKGLLRKKVIIRCELH